jgi:tetratricopeptide (TPR) repeat protein
MIEMQQTWEWVVKNIDTIAKIGTGIAAVFGGLWAVYTFFAKRGKKSSSGPGVTQSMSNIQAGGDVAVTQQNINVPIEQFDKLLKERNADILARLPQADPQEKQIFLKEIDDIAEKNKNLEQAKQLYEQKLAEAAKALEDYKKQFPPGEIDQARDALSRGDTQAAVGLFQQALQTGQAQAAEAAFNLGRLAEAQIDYAGARRYYEEAARLLGLALQDPGEICPSRATVPAVLKDPGEDLGAGPPGRGHQYQQPGRTLPEPRPVWHSRAPIRAGPADRRKSIRS